MSAPNNDHVKLHPANLVALQKANYLFHCAHNCFLVPVVVVVDDFSLKKKGFVVPTCPCRGPCFFFSGLCGWGSVVPTCPCRHI